MRSRRKFVPSVNRKYGAAFEPGVLPQGLRSGSCRRADNRSRTEPAGLKHAIGPVLTPSRSGLSRVPRQFFCSANLQRGLVSDPN